MTLAFRLAKEGYLPVHLAVEVGNMHVTKELLNMSADVQVRATYGAKSETAFHAATRRRDIELLRILSDNGSPVDAANVQPAPQSLNRRDLLILFIGATVGRADSAAHCRGGRR